MILHDAACSFSNSMRIESPFWLYEPSRVLFNSARYCNCTECIFTPFSSFLFFLVQTDKHADVGTETATLKLQPFYYYEQQVFTCSGAHPTLSAHVTLAGTNNRLRLTQTLINQRSYDEPEAASRRDKRNRIHRSGGQLTLSLFVHRH